MDNRNKHCALDDYFASMFSEPSKVSEESELELENSTLATVTVLRSDAANAEASVADAANSVEVADSAEVAVADAEDTTLADAIAVDHLAPDDIAPAPIPQVAYMETMRSPQAQSRPAAFAIPEPDESGTLKDLDQLLESVIDIDLENIDLSILDEEEAVAAQLSAAQEFAEIEQPVAVQLSPISESALVQATADAQEAELPIADLQPETTASLTEVVQTTDSHYLQQGEVASADTEAVPELEWQNVDLDEQFQALFFETAGVTFAVPLTELGGIHQTENINALFGKPDWFLGIMQYRDLKLSVVDTAKWVMPEQDMGDIDYKYLVQLNESNWVLGCETLIGTETLNRNDVKWRTTPGSRPWLAGMVKSRMCVLLHVTEMIKLLNNGINIHGQ